MSVLYIDDYSPDHYVSSYEGPPRNLCAVQRAQVLASHDLMMEEYMAAREQWERHREGVALGYAVEEADFAAENPSPRLADFMREQARYAETVRGMFLERDRSRRSYLDLGDLFFRRPELSSWLVDAVASG